VAGVEEARTVSDTLGNRWARGGSWREASSHSTDCGWASRWRRACVEGRASWQYSAATGPRSHERAPAEGLTHQSSSWTTTGCAFSSAGNAFSRPRPFGANRPLIGLWKYRTVPTRNDAVVSRSRSWTDRTRRPRYRRGCCCCEANCLDLLSMTYSSSMWWG